MAGPDPVSVGELLRRYRIQSGLTQEELAERAGMSARAIRALETSPQRAPRTYTLALLESALDLTAADHALLEAAIRRQRVPARPAGRASPSSKQPHIPLIGRQRERQALEHFLSSDAPPLLLLRGEPGIGKSRLLEEAAEQAQRAGWTVLASGCSRRSAQEPYAPCVDALARFVATRAPAQQRRDLQGCAWLVRLLPELAQRTVAPAVSWALPSQQERRLIFAAVARFLRNVAGNAGTLLILDDLHWAGADALDLLAFLLREDDGHPVRILGAYRDTDVSALDPLLVLLGDLAREQLATSEPLAPLGDDEAAHLLDVLLADVPKATTEARQRIVTRAGGVPFYLVTCAQDARSGALTGRPDEPAVPWSAASSIRQRVAQLAAPGWEVLAIAAVMQRAIPRDLLLSAADALGYGEATTLHALEATVRARLLTENPDGGCGFTHDLIRETVEADLSGARRAALHRCLADAIERQPQSEQRAAELSWHLARGDRVPRALPYTLRAGDLAESVSAHAEADQHYRTAAEWARQLGDRARLGEALDKRADVLYRLARFADAYTCLEEAIRIYRADQNWDRLAWTTAQIAKAGDPLGRTAASLTRLQELFATLAAVADEPSSAGTARTRESTALERVAERAVSLLSPRTAARVYLCLTSRLIFFHRFDEVYGPSDRTVQHARAAGDLRIESLAYMFRAEAQQARGLLAESAEAAVVARARAIDSGDLEALYMALRIEATNDELLAEPLRAHNTLERMLVTATQLDDLSLVTGALSALALIAFARGEWDDSTGYFERAVKLLHGNHSTAWNAPAIGLGVLNALRSEQAPLPSTALAEVEHTADDRVRTWATTILAELDLLAGGAELAAARLRRELERSVPAPAPGMLPLPLARSASVWMDAGVYGPLPAGGPGTRLLAFAAWAELERGNHTQSRQTLAYARPLADSQGNRMALVEVARVEAILALRESRWDDARRALDASLSISLRAPYPYAEAKARYLYGQLYAATNRRDDARQQYLSALAICERLGECHYHPHIERALSLLPQSGVPARPKRTRTRARTRLA
jgi:transcriptional regulator with XRE-family HTH domain/tetratricopeptide (TPR) repeat protein